MGAQTKADVVSAYELVLYTTWPAALAGDAGLAERVRCFDGTVEFVGADLVFTLPDLYRFVLAELALSDTEHDLSPEDYREFHRLLYQRATNTSLQLLGGKVVVDKAHDDHTLSRYRLVQYAPCPTG